MFVSKGQESLQKGDKMIDREKLLSIRESLCGIKFSTAEDARFYDEPPYDLSEMESFFTHIEYIVPIDFCEWDPDDFECQQERYNQW